MFRFQSSNSSNSILLAPRSKLGQFVARKTSWTLPDTRPKQPLVERHSSYLTQMRVSAEAFHATAVHNSRNFEDGGGVKRGKIFQRSSAPGRASKERFDFTEGSNTNGMTRRAVRSASKNGQRFGNWSS